MRKDDFLARYRSVRKPRPLWEEVALYGGYEYVELVDGIWVPRMHEYTLRYALAGNVASLRKTAADEVKSGGFLFRPSILQQSDCAKTTMLINKQTEVCIDRYSYAFEQFAQRFALTTFYTTGCYTTTNFIHISQDDFLKRASTTLTFVSESAYELKPHIRNWGNIIVYDASFFDDSISNNLLEGGDYLCPSVM